MNPNRVGLICIHHIPPYKKEGDIPFTIISEYLNGKLRIASWYPKANEKYSKKNGFNGALHNLDNNIDVLEIKGNRRTLQMISYLIESHLDRTYLIFN